MRKVCVALAVLIAIGQSVSARQVSTNYEPLTIYVTPTDVQLMIQEPHGLLMRIPPQQLGRINNIIVVLESSGRSGSTFERYRPNDPIYQNQPLPVLAAEFDEDSLKQLREAPLGMLFAVPADAVSKITHINLRISRAAANASLNAGATGQQPALNTPSSSFGTSSDFGLPPRQTGLPPASANRTDTFNGWNMDGRTGGSEFQASNTDLSRPHSSSFQSGNNSNWGGTSSTGGMLAGNAAASGSYGAPSLRDRPASGWNDPSISGDRNAFGANLAPLDNRSSAPSMNDGSTATGDSRNGYQQPLYANDYRDPYSRSGVPAFQQPPSYPEAAPSRREIEDRMAMNEMRMYLDNMERRVAQLTSDLQYEQSRRRFDRQSDANVVPAGSAPLPVIQEASAKSTPTTTGTAADSSLPRINGFLWFMLLCSIGINLYLAWISRGFYMRYAELADELRETFTAANS